VNRIPGVYVIQTVKLCFYSQRVCIRVLRYFVSDWCMC